MRLLFLTYLQCRKSSTGYWMIQKSYEQTNQLILTTKYWISFSWVFTYKRTQKCVTLQKAMHMVACHRPSNVESINTIIYANLTIREIQSEYIFCSLFFSLYVTESVIIRKVIMKKDALTFVLISRFDFLK